MKGFVGAALVAVATMLGGCQSTGSGIDPALDSYCRQYGYGQPGDPNYQRCLVDNSMGGRGEQLDKRAVGANGT